MRYSALAYRLPRFLRRHILHFETEIAGAVDNFAGTLPASAWVLDAGAGVQGVGSLVGGIDDGAAGGTGIEAEGEHLAGVGVGCRSREGERTALDNSMLLYCSSMLTGGHDATQLPVVMLGRGGNKLQTGQVLDYTGQPNRQMCRLYMSIMDKMNLPLNKFGDANENLHEV